MTASSAELDAEIRSYRQWAGMTRAVVAMNASGLTHEESLLGPEPAGNCMNWVLGHLLWAYDRFLPQLGREPALPAGSLDRYARGGEPLGGEPALEFRELLRAWDRACDGIDAGLAALTSERLAGPGVSTGDSAPDDTFRTSVNTVLFHQAYHGGQTGVLRRVAGREGAIR